MWQPPPLGRLGRRHCQNCSYPYRQHQRHSGKPCQRNRAHSLRGLCCRTARRPQQRRQRRRNRRNAGSTHDYQTCVRRTVFRLQFCRTQSHEPCHAESAGFIAAEKPAQRAQYPAILLRLRPPACQRHRNRRRQTKNRRGTLRQILP